MIGKSDFQTMGNDSIAEYYRTNDKCAFQTIYRGIEPTILKNELRFCYVQKIPIEDKEKKVIGLFWDGFLIENKNTHIFFEQLKDLQVLLTSSRPKFELNSHSKYFLTNRESECLFYTLRGKTSKLIGKILSISPKTVEFHLDHLKLKFNVHSKSELISKAIEEGFFEKIPPSILGILPFKRQMKEEC